MLINVPTSPNPVIRPKPQPGGFSIVEICIALLIATIFGAAAFATNSRMLVGIRSQKESTVATMVLQQRMESFRATAFSNIADRDFVKDNILAIPASSQGPLGQLTETFTIGVFPPDGSVNTVIRRTPSRPNGENVSENRNLANAKLLRVDITENWTGANGRSRTRQLSSIFGIGNIGP